jgi:hypothetical protein
MHLRKVSSIQGGIKSKVLMNIDNDPVENSIRPVAMEEKIICSMAAMKQ